MSETPKRTTSKNRKSKNEVVRSALGMYLKQRNYSATGKFRKSDLILSQTGKQIDINGTLEKDCSKVNSFLFSNVLCLNNNPMVVAQQFANFLQFICSQKPTIRSELEPIRYPLMCRLYIELLKGKDSKPAIDFLKRFSTEIDLLENFDEKIQPGNAKVKIEPPSMDIQTLSYNPWDRNNDYFKDLIDALSTCIRIDEIDSIPILKDFYYSKLEVNITLLTLYTLKRFLARNGHVIVLHLLQTWFSFQIQDTQSDDSPENEDEPMDNVTDEHKSIKMNGGDSLDRFEKIPVKQEVELDYEETVMAPPVHPQPPIHQFGNCLSRLRDSVIKMNVHQIPNNILRILNADNQLTTTDIDQSGCHIVAGFETSTIKLWQLNQSAIAGRKPFETYPVRGCPWSLNYKNLDEDELEDGMKFVDVGDDSSRNNYENFLQSSGVTLRGHTKGVTRILFSKHNRIMFSASKDRTMRAWHASTYDCRAIYRGHNFPIWCLAESPVGLYLATGGRDTTARLWSTDREHPLLTFIGHTQDINAIAFHPNGNYLATGSSDLTVRLWCSTSGKLFRVFVDCHQPVHCISFSRDGKYLAAGGDESKIRIFDLAAGSQINELKDHTGSVTDLVWNSNGDKLASCCTDGSIRVFNVTKSQSTGSTNPSTSGDTKLVQGFGTGCKRSIRVFFNRNDSITSIGSC